MSDNALVYEQDLMWKAVRKKMIKEKITYPQTAKTIGIGLSSLWRLNEGNTPSLINYFKVVRWLEADPNEFIITRTIEPYKTER